MKHSATTVTSSLASCRWSKTVSQMPGLLRILCFMIIAAFASRADAVTSEIEYDDFGPMGDFLSVDLSGPIEPGDASRLRLEISKFDIQPATQIYFSFNSPGGSVLEAMRIGRFIASLPHGVKTSVSQDVAGERRICASACVLAFLGGHYRSASPGTLGVHQFFFSGDSQLSGAEATSISQMMAADIVDYIREMRADPEFFSVMTRSYPDEMHWVPAEELERLRVLNGDIYDQKEEYKNSNGNFYLLLWQQSRYGENKMLVACGDDGPLLIAYLQPPEVYMNGSFDLVIDGQEFLPLSWEVVREPNLENSRWVEVVIQPSPEQVQRLMGASSMGARILVPSGYVFFGFVMSIHSTKLRDTLVGCRPNIPANDLPPNSAETEMMIELDGFDLPGGDLLQSGVRDLSFEQCKQLCQGIDGCTAVSWVTSMRWCWPKGVAGTPSPSQGIFSAIRR